MYLYMERSQDYQNIHQKATLYSVLSLNNSTSFKAIKVPLSFKFLINKLFVSEMPI